ncbi:PqqD family protein [Bifidobacterium scaligerum]|uniref:PqqD family protein n=1 Tax=Bifidobacterium scaligerum TaxID=2052656 RepID=A0A2M9HPC6_9BIFI|nr:PqqD family protein [Bifidobacterium scaligerum]PJM78657.1 PqqD family protein [Bifidobacterium scaligerum]
MKIKPGFVLREVAGQSIVIATGESSTHFHGMIKLNPTGAFIWKALEQGSTENELINTLTEQFTVSQETASKDVAQFIHHMNEHGFLEQ